MKKYHKPEITKVNLTTEEQILEYCKTKEEIDRGKCWGQNRLGYYKIHEVYGL